MELVLIVTNKVGFVDKPVGIKDHDGLPSYGGGIFILLSMVLLVGFSLLDTTFNVYEIAFVLALFSIGLLDDIRPIPAWIRLIFHLAIVLVFISSSLELSILWLIPVTLGLVIFLNAINLFDNANSSLVIYIISILAVHDMSLWLYLPFAIFFIYNIGNSKIFFGDSGSMLVAGLAIVLLVRNNDGISPNYLVGVLGLPFLDFVQVVCRRLYMGLNPMKGSPHHLSHVLRGFGLSPKVVGLFLGAAQILLVLGLGLANSLLMTLVLIVVIVNYRLFVWNKK